jgi:hypothetical protein
LVGITVKERINAIKKLNIGDVVYLIRDPNNTFDNQAIKVLNDAGEQLGFISKEWAFIYSQKMDIGMTYQASVNKIEDKVIYLNVKRDNTHQIIGNKILEKIISK